MKSFSRWHFLISFYFHHFVLIFNDRNFQSNFILYLWCFQHIEWRSTNRVIRKFNLCPSQKNQSISFWINVWCTDVPKMFFFCNDVQLIRLNLWITMLFSIEWLYRLYPSRGNSKRYPSRHNSVKLNLFFYNKTRSLRLSGWCWSNEKWTNNVCTKFREPSSHGEKYV